VQKNALSEFSRIVSLVCFHPASIWKVILGTPGRRRQYLTQKFNRACFAKNTSHHQFLYLYNFNMRGGEKKTENGY